MAIASDWRLKGKKRFTYVLISASIHGFLSANKNKRLQKANQYLYLREQSYEELLIESLSRSDDVISTGIRLNKLSRRLSTTAAISRLAKKIIVTAYSRDHIKQKYDEQLYTENFSAICKLMPKQNTIHKQLRGEMLIDKLQQRQFIVVEALTSLYARTPRVYYCSSKEPVTTLLNRRVATNERSSKRPSRHPKSATRRARTTEQSRKRLQSNPESATCPPKFPRIQLLDLFQSYKKFIQEYGGYIASYRILLSSNIEFQAKVEIAKERVQRLYQVHNIRALILGTEISLSLTLLRKISLSF